MADENKLHLLEAVNDVMLNARKRKIIEKPAIKYNSKNGWMFNDVAYGYGRIGQASAEEARKNWKPSQPENDIDNVL